MYQLEFDLRPSLTVQLELPFDYTGCDTRFDSLKCVAWSNSILVVSNGGELSWENSAIQSSEIVADTVVVRKPIKTIIENIKEWIKR